MKKNDLLQKRFVSLTIGLSHKQLKKIKELANSRNLSESGVLQEMIERCVKEAELNHKGFAYEPYKKIVPQQLVLVGRTITREQEIKLRSLRGKTGRSIGELVRRAVDQF